MAQSLDDARTKILTSVHGRRLGIDHAEFLAGVKGIRNVVTEATSATTGTNLPNHGLVSVVTTTNDTWTLTDPEAGVSVKLFTSSTSTGNHNVVPDNATIVSTNGAVGSSIVLQGAGARISLMGLSTAKWVVESLTLISTATATAATVVVSS